MKTISAGKISYLAMLAGTGIVFSYVEALIPVNFGIPGIKLGLANIAALMTMYLISFSGALIVQAIRIIITGFLFGNMYGIIYSLAGGLTSLAVMIIVKKTDKFGVTGVSICGGVVHNLAQLAVAMLIINQLRLSYYGPVLIISGVIMGLLIGIISIPILKVLKHMFDSGKIIL